MAREKGAGRKTGRKDTLGREIYEFGTKEPERASGSMGATATANSALSDITEDEYCNPEPGDYQNYPSNSMAKTHPEMIDKLKLGMSREDTLEAINMVNPQLAKDLEEVDDIEIDEDGDAYDYDCQMKIQYTGEYESFSYNGYGNYGHSEWEEETTDNITFEQANEDGLSGVSYALISKDQLLRQPVQKG